MREPYDIESLAGDVQETVRRHPDDREREHAESVRCIEEGRPFSMDYRMLTKDGRVMWVHDEDRVIRDEEGGVRSWQGVIVDITERKEAEQQNTEILESVTDGFVAWDSDWRYTYVNARAGEMFGRKPEDLVGKRDTYVLRVRGDSMIDEQIRDGDFVIVEDRRTADNGEMVIALLNGNAATMKPRWWRASSF